MKLKVKKLRTDAILPTRGSEKASGLDLYAVQDYKIFSGETVRVETGIAFGIPDGHEIQVRPRSGLSLKTGLRVANSPGTVDADYTGDCSVILHNTSQTPGSMAEIKRGDRVGQAVLCPVIIPELEEVDDLSATARGSAGFGSTGK